MPHVSGARDSVMGEVPSGTEQSDSAADDHRERDAALDQDPPAIGWVDVDELLTRHTPRRWRLTQLSLLVVSLVVLGALLLNSVFPLQSPLAGLLARQSMATRRAPAAKPVSSRLEVGILTDVTHATVLFNGQELPVPPPRELPWLQGENLLTLTAPPFLPHTCHVHVALTVDVLSESELTSGCIIGGQSGYGGPNGDIHFVRRIDFDLSVTADDLPSAARAQVIRYVQQLLTTSPLLATTVPGGQYVGTGIGPDGVISSTQAHAPVQATLWVLPEEMILGAGTGASASPLPPTISPTACAALRCPARYRLRQEAAATPLWSVQEGILLRWQFRTSAGAQVGSVVFQPPAPLTLQLAYDDIARDDPSGGWHLANPLSQTLVDIPGSVCAAGIPLLARELALHGRAGARASLAPGHFPTAQGCLLQIASATSTATSAATSNSESNTNGDGLGLVVWHFGVLLAADGMAHALLPALPVASAEEIAAVSSS